MYRVKDGSESYHVPILSEVGEQEAQRVAVTIREAVARDECLSGAGKGSDTWYIPTHGDLLQ